MRTAVFQLSGSVTRRDLPSQAKENWQAKGRLRSWYTTPQGSRIAELSTQGDQTGGAIVSWIVIGGANGFVINPKQFFYMDSPFTDAGVVQGPDPAYHRVATGKEYQFSIDYSNLAKDPNSGGAYVYAPGDPVAEWN